MQVRHFFLFLLCSGLILLSSSAKAQEVTTNELGEKIVVYPDGSWKYFDELGKEEVSEVDELQKESKKKKRKEKKRKKKRKKQKSNKKEFSPAEEEQARKEATQMAEWAAERESAAQRVEEDAVFNRIFLEEELKEAFESTETTTADIDALEAKLKAAKAAEKAAKKEYKKAQKDAEIAEKMIDMKKAKRDKMLAKIEKEKRKERIEEGRKLQETTLVSEELKEEESGVSDQKVWASEMSDKQLKKYSVEEDVMFRPPTAPCNYSYDDIDEFTGKRRRDLVKRPFFNHTSDRLKPYFRERDHINGEGFISATSDGVKYFNLQVTILSEQAQREFGVLEKGSILSIKLLNGDAVKLFNTKTSTGTVSKINKTTTYRGQYMISGDQQKQIKKNEVDKVRIVWSTGYEDYDVYELDFFIDQFRCLED
ncbi:MAG: hypothetical protein AAF985_21820 [Bacteroidota bacterium]